MNALCRRQTLEMTAGTAGTPPTRHLAVVVGYDGSPPARRALDRAMSLLSHYDGSLEVVYVANLPPSATLPPDALAEVMQARDDETRFVAGQVRAQLLHQDYPWHFQRRDGEVATELIGVAAALHQKYAASADVVIIVGGPAHRYRHLGGSAAANVVRADAFPVIVVP